MVDVAIVAAYRATGERQADFRLRSMESDAAVYAFGALYDLFTAVPDVIAKRMGFTRRDGWMPLATRSRKFKVSTAWRDEYAGFVARQLGIAVDRWRREQDGKVAKRAASEKARGERRTAEARARREAAEVQAAAEAQEEAVRRKAVLASAREIDLASQAAAEAHKSKLTPRVYTSMPKEKPRPMVGLRTARLRDGSGDLAVTATGKALEGVTQRRVIEMPGMPPAGRSALEMRRRGDDR